MIKRSIEHLKNNNMTYVQHFIFAATHGLNCLMAGICLICHAVLPAIFPSTGSSLISDLNKSFTDNRNNNA